MSLNVINGALHNFLGTYTSRYSDFNGYWLFGKLIDGVDKIEIDLLSSSENTIEITPRLVASQIALQKFREQISKVGVDMARIREARLSIMKLPDSKKGMVNNQLSNGYFVEFAAMVILDCGKAYKRETSLFVAPHNPRTETRRNINIIAPL